MAIKLTKDTDSKAKKFTAREYNYDDGVDPKDLLENKSARSSLIRKLFHT